jgi:hypothetical protein
MNLTNKVILNSGGRVVGTFPLRKFRSIRKMGILIVVFLFGMVNLSNAQKDPLSEMTKINQAYLKSGEMFFKSTISMFRKGNLSKAVDKIDCQYALKGSDYYCKMGPIEMVKNKDLYVSIDHEDHYLTVGDVKKVPSQQNVFVTGLASLKQLLSDKTYTGEVSTSGNQSILVLTAKPDAGTEVKKYTVYYKADSYLINRVLMETVQVNEEGAEEEMVLETIYNYDQTKQGTSIDQYLNLSRFVKINGKTIEPGNAFKKYQLINQL